jgi:hypothetical protein
MNRVLRSVTFVVLVLAAPLVAAHTIFYGTPLSGAAESPPNGSTGFGNALLTIDLDLVTMRVEASFAALQGNTTQAHIHCCTLVPGAGNIGVASTTPSFPGFPTGVTAGSYDNTFDLSLASSYNAAFITANGGTVSGALNALLNGLAEGRAYFNIHTTSFGGGEIRGFFAPVPLPAALWLLAPVVGGLLAATRRTRASRA